jgi:hydrogenase/urease accessory protein HupE
MIVRLAIAVALALLVSAAPALAHPPPLGIGGFWGGLLHPLFVPAHALAVLALGLLIGQQTAWGRMPVVAFVLGLAVGLGVMTLGVVPRLMNEVMLICALIAGLVVALARPVSEVLGCAFTVLAGFCIALDSPPEAISLTEANLMLAGTGLGGALLLVAVAAVASRLKSKWTRVAARVLGSWIAASAILVLALRLAG